MKRVSRRSASCFIIPCVLLASAICVRRLYRSDIVRANTLDPTSITVNTLLHVFKSQKEYLDATGWQMEDGTFAPMKVVDQRERKPRYRVAGGLLVRPFTAAWWITTPIRRLAKQPFKAARWLASPVQSVLTYPFRVVSRPLHLPLRRLWREMRVANRSAAMTSVLGSQLSLHSIAPSWDHLRGRGSHSDDIPAATIDRTHGVKMPRDLADFTREIVHSSKENMCGNGVAEVHHISAILPGVDPVYAMEVMTNPDYGVSWNPAVEKVIFRRHQHVSPDAILSDLLSKDLLQKAKDKARFATGQRDFDLVAQVTELPVPMAVKRALGARYSADLIGGRFDCKSRRGFTLGTSLGAEKLADAAGVEKGQELCMSAMMIAPYRGSEWNGTRFHIVTHFDPKVVSRPLRSIVHATVPKCLRQMLSAFHKKAHEVQARGQQPYINCA